MLDVGKSALDDVSKGFLNGSLKRSELAHPASALAASPVMARRNAEREQKLEKE
ncbi:hypothetical protein [Methylocapsa palsarum]|uniref:hypothetical protein n=1 Tax=Methylocapsa palsarum TaxID=1612308 RepID=UPI001FCD437B|nr:hypothetical protein [Methylocapsa palsarum]